MPHFVKTYTDLQAFAAVALPFFLRDEARHNLQLGNLQRMLEASSPEPAVLATLHSESGELTAIATQSPAHRLLLSGGGRSAIVELADVIASAGIALPGVMAPPEVAAWFTQAWCRSGAVEPASTMRTGLFLLHHLPTPPLSPGQAVVANGEHLPLLCNWTRNFFDELELRTPPPPLERLRQRVDAGNAVFWLLPSGEPASMSCLVRESPSGATVSIVYTPPPLRGQGFASACVAKACEVAFQRGKQFCTLFADLDNPTSTGLYKRLGFQPIAALDEVSFAATAHTHRRPSAMA